MGGDGWRWVAALRLVLVEGVCGRAIQKNCSSCAILGVGYALWLCLAGAKCDFACALFFLLAPSSRI